MLITVTQPFAGLELKVTYLSDGGRLSPFLSQVIWGVGEPRQLHLRQTGGPGCSVCSMNS